MGEAIGTGCVQEVGQSRKFGRRIPTDKVCFWNSRFSDSPSIGFERRRNPMRARRDGVAQRRDTYVRRKLRKWIVSNDRRGNERIHHIIQETPRIPDPEAIYVDYIGEVSSRNSVKLV
jgi:hypothetical protein